MAKKKRGGRTSPNLKRKDGYIVNQYGVKITDEEARMLRNVVAQVNRRAAAQEKAFKGAPLYFGSRRLDENREQLKLMGEQMDIMIRKRSAALQGFKSKKEFNAYLRSAKNAASFDYLDYRGKLYKRNLIKAINEQFAEYPELTKGIVMRIQMMKQSEFQKMVGSNRAMQMGYVYAADQQLERIFALRDSLRLNSDKFEDYDY